MTRGGRAFELPTPALRTPESECSSSPVLPTPLASDGRSASPADARRRSPQLRAVDVLLPTTTAMDSEASGGSSPDSVTLTDAVERTALGTRPNPRHLLPTPQAADSTGGRHNRDRAGGEGGTLPGTVLDVLLPTPAAHDSGNTPEQHLRKKPGREQVTSLQVIVDHGLLPSGGHLLPTPTVGNANGSNVRRGGERAGELLLPGVAEQVAEQAEHLLERAATWGPYWPAVDRWERLRGVPVPAPTLPDGKDGRARMNAALPEWMMGLDPGHITAVPGITRRAALKAAGNGVVPQQAALAIRTLLDEWDTDAR